MTSAPFFGGMIFIGKQMNGQDYYSKWSSMLTGGVEEDKNKEKEEQKKQRDYYAEWSAKLAKEPLEGKHPWQKEYLPELVKGSPFLQKLMAGSGMPIPTAIGKGLLPEPQATISPGKAFGQIKTMAQELGEKATGGLAISSWTKKLEEEERKKRVAAAALEHIKAGGMLPRPPKDERGFIRKAVDTAVGVGKGVAGVGKELAAFVPELYTDLATDPLKTIEERPLDILFMIEGVAGPRLRMNAKSLIHKAKGGRVDTKEVAKILDEFKAEYAPDAEFGAVYGEGGAVIGPSGIRQPARRVRLTGPQVIETAEGTLGREVKGLMAKLVDEKGKPISWGEAFFKPDPKNIKAAEDLIVATTGAIVKPGQPTAPIGPVEELMAGIKTAKPLTKEQMIMRTQERGKRMATAQEQIEAKGLSGEKWFEELKGSQAGEMPKVAFESIEKNFTPGAIDGLFDMIKASKTLDNWERLGAGTGLKKILHGTLPQPAELEKMQRVFGQGFVQELMKKQDFWTRALEKLYQTANVPRSLMASYDLSAPFRQGIFLIGRPKQFFPAMGPMFKYFGSEKAYQGLLEDIVSRPTYGLMKKAKLSLSDLGAIIGKREEVFASNLAEKVPGVRASGRAYSGFLNKLRADTFDSMIKAAEKMGHDPAKNEALLESLGRYINSATGRGTIAGFEKAGLALNSFFFSPRLMMSRFNMINPMFYAKLDPFVRKEALKTMLASMSVGVTALGLAKAAGAEVFLDPKTADFGKIKIGNTRVDVFGGFLQYWRFFLNLGDHLGKTAGITKGKKENYLDNIYRFLESKEAPVFSLGVDIMRGKTYLGEELKIDRLLATRLTPMVAQDLVDILRDDPDLAYLVVPALFGVGLQTYPPRKRKKKIF